MIMDPFARLNCLRISTMMVAIQSQQSQPPRCESLQLLDFLAEHYGLGGNLQKLKNEKDQTFHLTTQNGQGFLIRVSPEGEDIDLAECRLRALMHLRATEPELTVPNIQSTLSSQLVGQFETDSKVRHGVRVVDDVGAVAFRLDLPPSKRAARNAAQIHAKVTKSLSSFSYQVDQSLLPLDTTSNLIRDPGLWACGGSDIRAYEAVLRPHFSAAILPSLKYMRTQVIQNSGHLVNLLCSDKDTDAVIGVFDLGDLVQAPLVWDLAALTLSLLDQSSDPVEMCSEIVGGFHSNFPLQLSELELLYDVILMREALSVLLVDLQTGLPTSPSILANKSRPQMMATITKLLETGRQPIVEAIHKACPSNGHQSAQSAGAA